MNKESEMQVEIDALLPGKYRRMAVITDMKTRMNKILNLDEYKRTNDATTPKFKEGARLRRGLHVDPDYNEEIWEGYACNNRIYRQKFPPASRRSSGVRRAGDGRNWAAVLISSSIIVGITLIIGAVFI